MDTAGHIKNIANYVGCGNKRPNDTPNNLPVSKRLNVNKYLLKSDIFFNIYSMRDMISDLYRKDIDEIYDKATDTYNVESFFKDNILKPLWEKYGEDIKTFISNRNETDKKYLWNDIAFESAIDSKHQEKMQEFQLSDADKAFFRQYDLNELEELSKLVSILNIPGLRVCIIKIICQMIVTHTVVELYDIYKKLPYTTVPLSQSAKLSQSAEEYVHAKYDWLLQMKDGQRTFSGLPFIEYTD